MGLLSRLVRQDLSYNKDYSCRVSQSVGMSWNHFITDLEEQAKLRQRYFNEAVNRGRDLETLQDRFSNSTSKMSTYFFTKLRRKELTRVSKLMTKIVNIIYYEPLQDFGVILLQNKALVMFTNFTSNSRMYSCS